MIRHYTKEELTGAILYTGYYFTIDENEYHRKCTKDGEVLGDLCYVPTKFTNNCIQRGTFKLISLGVSPVKEEDLWE